MTDDQTLDFLLKGGWFALEQAGRLIRDAAVLMDAGSHSSAVALALLSREEVSKARTLFKLWMRATQGEAITSDIAVKHITKLKHFEKQRLAATTFNVPADFRVPLAGSAAALEYFDEVAASRVKKREEALYVDASPQGNSWRRPADIGLDEAKDIIADARSDYWQQYGSPGIPGWATQLDQLKAALEQWHDKPPLYHIEF